MRTNLEKWNHYKALIDEKLNQFVTENFPEIPKVFYKVERSGIVSTCESGGLSCNYPHYFGKSPKRGDIDKIADFYQNWDSRFNKTKIYLDFKSNDGWSSAICITNLQHTYVSIEQATEKANEVIRIREEERTFQETHAKDKNYNYIANGYKFLGWQNGWKREEKNPEYDNCREQKHRLIDVSHTPSGSEHVVSCPVCKIYYKYDCSG